MPANTCQKVKVYSLVLPQAIKDNAAWDGTATSGLVRPIDTKGYASGMIVFQLGSIDATMADLRLQHSDSSSSGFVDWDGMDFETDSTIPGGSDDNGTYVWRWAGGTNKRYVRVYAVAGDGAAGTYAYCQGILFDPEDTPDTDTAIGASDTLDAFTG